MGYYYLLWFLIGAYTLGAIVWNTNIRHKFYFICAKIIVWLMKISDKIMTRFDAGEK